MRVLLSLLITIFVTIAAYAQSSSTTGAIVGTVRDPLGAVITGAAITIIKLGTNFTRTTTVTEKNIYQFVQLPPGRYQITANAEGFASKTEIVTLALGTTVLAEFDLKTSGSDEVVEITATNVLNEGRTENSANIEKLRIENLPINRRNFLDFSLTAARVTVDVISPGTVGTSGFSVNGQTGRGNNITVDGVDNNDLTVGGVRLTISQEAVQEFQVVTDSYSAEFGRALGGVINIVTSGGTNETRGSLFYFNRNDDTSARNAFAVVKPNFAQHQFGLNLSAPIKRDRAFFFTAFERLSVRQNVLVNISDETIASVKRIGFIARNGSVPTAVTNTLISGRADFRVNSNDTLYLKYSYGGSYNGVFDGFGNLSAETKGSQQRLDDHNVTFNNTYVNAGANLVNETRFLYSRRDQLTLPFDDGPELRLDTEQGDTRFGRGQFLPQPREENIYQIINNVSLVRGLHNLRFGVDYTHVGTKARAPLFGGGLAAFSPLNFSALAGIPGLPFFTSLQAFDPAVRTPAQRSFLVLLSALLPSLTPGFPAGVRLVDLSLPTLFVQGFGDPELNIPTSLFSTFIQDEIRLRPNLLMKAGVRYDIVRTRSIPENNGNFSPRIGLSYRPAQLPNLNVRAAYGIFFAGALTGPAFFTQPSEQKLINVAIIPFPFAILPFALPGHKFPASDRPPAGIGSIPQLSESFQYARDYRNSYSQQASLGCDYLVGNNTVLSLNYQFVRGLRLISRRNINPVVRPVRGNTLQSAITGRIDPTRGTVQQFESAFDSYYHAFTVQVERRLARRLNFLAHYTFSKAIDNFQDIRSESRAFPLAPGLDRGLSLQDLRNRFVASATWQLDYYQHPLLRGYTLATIFTTNSGRPFNVRAGVDLNGDGDNNDRPLGIGRNTGISRGFAGLNIRLSRAINIGERVKFQGYFEAFNALNRVNFISGPNFNFPPDAQGNFNLPPMKDGRFILPQARISGALDPRQLQFGLRLNF